MSAKKVKIGNVTIGKGGPLALIAGPCVIESAESAFEHAGKIKKIAERMDMPFIFKSSYDKANRSSVRSFRGPGFKEGLEILRNIKKELDVPVLSDIHLPEEADRAAEVLDCLQIPAFLCRQTDLLIKAARTGKPVNVKKGQFMSPAEMTNVIEKIESTGNKNIILTERGTFFGYNNLVNDFKAMIIMGETGYPVVYDATHSVQTPGGKGTSTGGDSSYILPLSRAAVACGCDALFVEVHKEPKKALSDGPNMLELGKLEDFITQMKSVEKAVKRS